MDFSTIDFAPLTSEVSTVTEQTTLSQSMPSSPSPTTPWYQDDIYDKGQGQQQPRLDTIVSDSTVHIVGIVVVTILCGIVSASGLVANVINIFVFFRQGALSSSSNASLLALAFADIGCLIPVFCNSINYAFFYLGHVGIFLTPRDFMDTVVLWPHIMFMQIVSWITAYIAFERCMCVFFPLKMKLLFSAKKSALIATSIALIAIATFMPTFMTQRIASISDPSTNTSRIIFMPTQLHIEIVEASDVLHAIVLRPLALLIVFVCTHLTICGVKRSARWRKSIAAASTNQPSSSRSSDTTPMSSAVKSSTNNSVNGQCGDGSCNQNPDQTRKIFDVQGKIVTSQTSENSSTVGVTNQKAPNTKKSQSTSVGSKESRLVKMITAISTIFLVCNAPDVIGVFVLISLQSTLQLSLGDNLFSLIIAAQLLLESIHSAMNIFVYYNMSSTYKHTLRAMIRRK